MKKNELTKAVLTALLLASSSAMAGADYPAADFQPKVIYADESSKSAPAASASKAAPAAVEKDEVDANYPAAHYQPKVLFSDADYKHSASAPSLGASSGSAAVSASEAPGAESEQPVASNNNLIGLVVLAAVGFFLYSKKSGGKAAKADSSDSYSAASGETTGVEKYLDRLGMNKTGVAKYLEKQSANPATGVAKYMAKQIVKDREAAAAKVTGVEKYLRDKG